MFRSAQWKSRTRCQIVMPPSGYFLFHSSLFFPLSCISLKFEMHSSRSSSSSSKSSNVCRSTRIVLSFWGIENLHHIGRSGTGLVFIRRPAFWSVCSFQTAVDNLIWLPTTEREENKRIDGQGWAVRIEWQLVTKCSFDFIGRKRWKEKERWAGP